MDKATGTSAPRQLLAYTFPPGSGFEGQLLGMLERIESGGAMRILDALFVSRDDSGELVAASLSPAGSAGMIGELLSFRLEQSARAQATQRALEGQTGALVRSLAEKLEPGGAVAGLLVEHSWALMLSESTTRLGGTQLLSQFVDAGELSDAWPQPAGAAQARPAGSP
jgi:hypothetical protein